MQQNMLNSFYPMQNPAPNAVSINIFSPQAFGQGSVYPQNPQAMQNFQPAQVAYALQNDVYGPSPYMQQGTQSPFPQPYQNPYMQNPIPQYLQPYPQNYPQNNSYQNPSIYPNNSLYDKPNEGSMNYPNNYNNLTAPTNQNQGQAPLPTSSNNPLDNSLNAANGTNLLDKTPSEPSKDLKEAQEAEDEGKSKKKNSEKTKTITPLTDDYIKTLENYLNSDNPKVRLIGAKTVMERFKEDIDRKDNPSLVPLLNKTLKDPNAAVRFLGLTALQLGYSVGNNETVEILKQIAQNTDNKLSEDYALALEALLKLSAPEPEIVKEDKS